MQVAAVEEMVHIPEHADEEARAFAWAATVARAEARAPVTVKAADHPRPETKPDLYAERQAYMREQERACSTLFLAVLKQAMDDAEAGDATASEFLKSNDPVVQLCRSVVERPASDVPHVWHVGPTKAWLYESQLKEPLTSQWLTSRTNAAHA